VPIRRRWEAVVSLIANGTHNTTKFVFESITKGRSNAPSTWTFLHLVFLR
jgi:hypothetical protein